LSVFAVASYVLWGTAGVCLIWAVAVIALRGVWGLTGPVLFLGLAGLPVAFAAAAVGALRAMPTRSSSLATLDRSGNYAGFMMTAEEQPLGDWKDRIADRPLPRLQWRWRQAVAWTCVAVCLVVASFFTPPRLARYIGTPRLEIGADVDQLARKVDVLRDEHLLSDERAQSLLQKLEQLREQASAKEPARTLEALDHVAEATKQVAEEAGADALRQTSRLAKAEALADALKKAKDEMSPKMLTRAMAELAKLTERADAENKLVEKSDAESSADKKEMTPEQLEKMAKDLGASMEDLARMMKKLSEEGLIDPDMVKQCEDAGKCDNEGLLSYLKGKEDGDELADVLARAGGKGGVSDDGPSDTPLTWGKESSDDGVTFKEEALPPGALADLKRSQLEKLSRADPKKGGDGENARSGALAGAAQGGGSAVSALLLPRDRGIVKRYFDRPVRADATPPVPPRK
jgi:hypothetical protein